MLVAIGGVLASRAASVLDVDDFSSVLDRYSAGDERRPHRPRVVRPSCPRIPRIRWATSRPRSRSCSGRSRSSRAAQSRSQLPSKESSCSALVVASWRRLASIFGRLRSEPYVTYAVVYLLMFFFAFGTIGNFGILARQRSQAMPFVFVLLRAVPCDHEEPIRGPPRSLERSRNDDGRRIGGRGARAPVAPFARTGVARRPTSFAICSRACESASFARSPCEGDTRERPHAVVGTARAVRRGVPGLAHALACAWSGWCSTPPPRSTRPVSLRGC